MIIGIQIVGILFGLGMLYFTNLYYRRRELTLGDFFVWGLVWVVFLAGVAFPSSLNMVMESLDIIGAIQFFTIIGFMFMFLVVFFMYKTVRKIQRKTELLVKHIALQRKNEK